MYIVHTFIIIFATLRNVRSPIHVVTMFVKECVTLVCVGRVQGAERGRVRVVGLDTPFSAPKRCQLVEILVGRLEDMNYYKYII